MANHIGEIVTIADEYTLSIANDHIAVQPYWNINTSTYSAYARSQFNPEHGPEPIPRFSNDNEYPRRYFLETKRRGWNKVEIICENVPLEKALELATVEAQKRNLVLYFQGPHLKKEIKWHPEGWQPFSL